MTQIKHNLGGIVGSEVHGCRRGFWPSDRTGGNANKSTFIMHKFGLPPICSQTKCTVVENRKCGKDICVVTNIDALQ